jgi:hypothetical protein
MLPTLKESFNIRPLPKKVIDLVGNELSKMKGFHPYKTIEVVNLFDAFHKLSSILARNKLGDLVYEFMFLPNPDIQNIIFELYVRREGLRPKVCVMSERMNLKGITANEFMKKFINVVKDTNHSISEWNDINRNQDITFYSRPPIEVLNDMFIQKMHEYSYFNSGSQFDGFHALEILKVTDELRFGEDREWSFNSTFTGNMDWGVVQYWITHKALPVSFVMEEIEGDFYSYYGHRDLKELFELAIKRIVLGMKQWNVYIKENELRGVVRNGKPINLEGYASKAPA